MAFTLESEFPSGENFSTEENFTFFFHKIEPSFFLVFFAHLLVLWKFVRLRFVLKKIETAMHAGVLLLAACNIVQLHSTASAYHQWRLQFDISLNCQTNSGASFVSISPDHFHCFLLNSAFYNPCFLLLQRKVTLTHVCWPKFDFCLQFLPNAHLEFWSGRDNIYFPESAPKDIFAWCSCVRPEEITLLAVCQEKAMTEEETFILVKMTRKIFLNAKATHQKCISNLMSAVSKWLNSQKWWKSRDLLHIFWCLDFWCFGMMQHKKWI